MATPKNTICLWYDHDAEEAARFYAATFPNSKVGAVFRAPSDYPAGKAGDVLTVEFTVCGVPCIGLNGGPEFKHNEAFSSVLADHSARANRCAGTRRRRCQARVRSDDANEEDRRRQDRSGPKG